MPGRPKDPRHFRLASGRQLWRLNTIGRLRLADDAATINSDDAKLVIRCPGAWWLAVVDGVPSHLLTVRLRPVGLSSLAYAKITAGVEPVSKRRWKCRQQRPATHPGEG